MMLGTMLSLLGDLMRPWRVVANALATHKDEQRVAAAATEWSGPPRRVNNVNPQQINMEGTDCPLPPSVRTSTITQGASGISGVPVTMSSVAEEELSLPTAPTAPIESEKGASERTSANSFPSNINPFTTGAQGREGLQPSKAFAVTPPVDLNVPFDPGPIGLGKERWRQIANEALREGNYETAAQLTQAFPVVYSPTDAQGNVTVNMTNLYWKLLTQLRSTVNDSGLKGEPTRQMLDYIWGTNILLPGDIRGIMKLILTQHQQLLFNAHWQSVCQEAVAVIRAPGDPLYGVTLEELMGLGPYYRLETQALLGPDKAKESMRLARRALDQIREPGGIPSYMGIKQGREEPFGLFIDRVANAIQAAGVPDYLKGTILKQCAIQNCNPSTRSILATLPGTWTIEEGLERMAQVPVGPQAMLVDVIKQLGNSMKEQAQVFRETAQQSQNQVLAALAPLQTPGGRPTGRGSSLQPRCFRCGITGHRKRECKTRSVWCHLSVWCVGKRPEQREGPPRDDTKSGIYHSGRNDTVYLRPVTRGSLGLDLATAVDVTLLDSKPTRVGTGVMGPVIVNGDPVGALLIGRSSATLNGLQILVGLIDKDYCGEIQIIVSAMFPPMHVPRNTKIAQLIPLPHLAASLPPMVNKDRGLGAFGSTGKIALLTLGMQQRPRQKITVCLKDEKLQIEALLDTGADVTIIIAQSWPPHWPTFESSLQQKNDLTLTLKQMGLILAPEKVQETSPWKFLGWKITDSTIQPQKLTIQSDIKTLNDAQKLLGDLQWIRPVVGIPNELLNPLRPLLKGTDPASKVTLSEKQQEILQQIASLITTSVTHRRISDKPLDLTVLCGSKCLMGAITQQKIKTGEKGGETVVLEWIAPPLQPRRKIQEKIATLAELVKKGRNRILQVDGVPPNIIWLPMKPGDLEWYIQNSEELQAALLQDGATIVAKTLQSTALTWMENQGWITKPKRSSIPLKNAVTVFTDAGKRSRTAAVTWKDEYGWKHQILQAQDKDITDIRERVDKTLFVLNHLCVFGDDDEPPATRHYIKSENDNKCIMRVLYRDMKTGQWLRPADVNYMGRGYVCISSPTGPTWVPSRCVKPAIEEKSSSTNNSNHG
uniref:Protease n=1 Tax=Anas zonorhyncha TaxID=75864 RepID=A0A8B9ZWM6_9AVES